MESDLSGRESDSGASPGRVDATDRLLLRELGADGRLPVAELAARAHISRSSAYARLERLRETGVITGFTARIDPHAVGLDVAALVFIQVNQDHWQSAQGALAAVPEVEFVGLAAADFDCVVLVRTTDTDALRDVVLGRLRAIPDVRSTRTVILLGNTVKPPAVP